MRRLVTFGFVVVLATAGCRQAERAASERSNASSPLETARAGATTSTLTEAGRRAEATPGARAEAEPRALVLPAGTALPVRLETALSSAKSRSGDVVVGRVAEDVRVGDTVALPGGTEVRGKVRSAIPSGRVKGRAHLAFDFDTLVVDGTALRIEARAVDITAPSAKKKDAAIIGGGAVGGAVVGALVGGKKGAGIGALAGGAAGTGVVLGTKGAEVEVPAGSRLRVRLSRELRVS